MSDGENIDKKTNKRIWTYEERKRWLIRRAYNRKRKRINKGRVTGLAQDVIEEIYRAQRNQIVDNSSPAIQRGRRGVSLGMKTMSSGVLPNDIWDPASHAPSEVRIIDDDDRRGLVMCSKCGGQVKTVEVNGVWQTRDLDGLPHRLTCSGKKD